MYIYGLGVNGDGYLVVISETLGTLWIIMTTPHHPVYEHDCLPLVILGYYQLIVMIKVHDSYG